MPPEALKLYKVVLQDIFSQDETERENQCRMVDEKIEKLKIRQNSLEDKFLENIISAEDYQSIKERLQREMGELEQQKEEFTMDKTSFQKYMEYGLPFLYNMAEYYRKADLEVKQKIVGSIFPGKLIFSEEKYRTTELNALLALSTLKINGLEEIKNGRNTMKSKSSTKAPPAGLEPATL